VDSNSKSGHMRGLTGSRAGIRLIVLKKMETERSKQPLVKGFNLTCVMMDIGSIFCAASGGWMCCAVSCGQVCGVGSGMRLED
jgi:hypothetical protein